MPEIDFIHVVSSKPEVNMISYKDLINKLENPMKEVLPSFPVTVDYHGSAYSIGVFYLKGGTSMFSDNYIKRGYYLNVNRKDGIAIQVTKGYRKLLCEVGRQSKKQLLLAKISSANYIVDMLKQVETDFPKD